MIFLFFLISIGTPGVGAERALPLDWGEEVAGFLGLAVVLVELVEQLCNSLRFFASISDSY